MPIDLQILQIRSTNPDRFFHILRSRKRHMIPDLPKSVPIQDNIEFYEKLVARLDGQSQHHTMWYSHKRDPSVCWMCDQQILCYRVLDLCKQLIQSPPLDIETDLESESDSVNEIENKPTAEQLEDIENYNEPEYDVEGDEC